MPDAAFVAQVNALSQQNLQLCYHCHKCTAGCPVVAEMTYGPDRILRMIQSGERQRLLSSHDIWLCASCETCGARCPNEIDIARIMDALRQMALEDTALAASLAEPGAVKFHRLFLFVVQHLGRMHEASLLMTYKVLTLNLVADMDSGLRMFFKGKIPLLPQRIKDWRQVQHIFKAVAAPAPEKRKS